MVPTPEIAWVDDPGLGLVLEAEVSHELTWSVEVEVRLGALRGDWVQAAPEPSAGALRVVVEPPPEAFLHDLALDYATDLHVMLVGTDEGGRAVERWKAPSVVLVWPHGRESAAEVWDHAKLQQRAPGGVLDAELRSAFGDLGGVRRVVVPIHHEVRPIDDDVLVPEPLTQEL